jgi:hypothetical protein
MPSLAGFLILPLVGGFFFLEILSSTRFYFRKQEGHRLFLTAASAGIALFGIARALTLQCYSTPLGAWVRSSFKSFARFDFSGAAVGALLLGLTLPWLGNLRWKAGYRLPLQSRAKGEKGGRFRWQPQGWPFRLNYSDALRRVARKSDELLWLLLRAQDHRRQILVSLDNGKAYVGYVLKVAHLAPELPYVKLVPTMSGHRSKDNLDLELTNVYGKTVDLVDKGVTTGEQEDQLLALQIVLKRDKILSASFFDGDLYRSQRQDREKRR